VSTISDGFQTGEPNVSMAPAPQAAAVDGAGGSDESGGANLDKVRDILFGAQMRIVDRRFAQLEERITTQAAELADQLRRQLAALEDLVKRNADALGQRLTSESEYRSEATSRLTRELGETAGAYDRRAGALEARIDSAQHDLRHDIQALSQRLTDDMREKFDEVLSRLGKASAELRSEKADRATIAALLTEMARRLASDESGQGFDTTRNG
jgi:hypothetical protein